MTLEVDGIDIIAMAEAAAVVGGIVLMLVAGLLFYLLVRPPRHVRQARRRPTDPGPDEAEEMLRLMDRMEARLEGLERALAKKDDSSNGFERPEISMLDEDKRSTGRMQ